VKLPAYPRYKASGIPWVGDIPEEWEVKRLRFAMRMNPSAPRLRALKQEDEVSFIPMEAVGIQGGLDLEQTRTIAEISNGYTEFQDGDVVVAKITPCFENGKAALARGLHNGAAYGTTELHVLRAGESLNERFLFYLSISDSFRKLGESEMYGAGGQKRVPPEFCKNFRTPLPRLTDQQAIADFLDRETGRIDRLVAQKRELIERLKEKRKALISRSVTRGLPPAAARAAGIPDNPLLVDSGFPWLGTVPSHWSVLPFRRVTQRVDVGIAEAATHAYSEEGVPLVRSTNIKSQAVDTTDLLFIEEEFAARLHSKALQAGDIVTTRTGANLGVSAVIPPNLHMAQCFTLLISTLLSDCDPRFYNAFINADPGATYFAMASLGAGQHNISVPILKDMPTVRPPLSEQRLIVAYIEKESAKLNAMVEKVEVAIDRLQEYRTALITAAVTGKIDVRSAAA
jgi:type I restriction enzyme, S subunit